MRANRWLTLLALLSTTVANPAWADACMVHSQGQRVDVQVCQENRSIPRTLFHDGFCQPQLKDQKVSVNYADQCPSGGIGTCSDAQVPNMPYRYDIHYYGVASDVAYLKPFCEQQNGGKWQGP